METLIVVSCALAALVFIEAVYWIAVSLARWSPVLAAGALAGWVSHNHEADALEALVISLLTCVLARHLLRPCRQLLDPGGRYC